jgi:hypothetical protein
VYLCNDVNAAKNKTLRKAPRIDAQDMHWGSNVNNDKETIKTEAHALDPHHGNLCNELHEKKEEEFLADKEEVMIRQHGDHHPAVKIYWPSLECACGGRLGDVTPRGAGGGEAAGDHSNAASISSEREEEEEEWRRSACRAGAKGSWIVSVSGLIPGFLRLYMLDFRWSFEGEDPQEINRVHVLAEVALSGTHRFRIPLTESGGNGTSVFDLISRVSDTRNLRVNAAVLDRHAGLAEKESLIGALDISLNIIRVRCSHNNSTWHASPTFMPHDRLPQDQSR